MSSSSSSLGETPQRRLKKRYVFATLVITCFVLYGAALISSHVLRSRRVVNAGAAPAVAAGVPGAAAASAALDRWASFSTLRDAEGEATRGSVGALRRMKSALHAAALSGDLGRENKAKAEEKEKAGLGETSSGGLTAAGLDSLDPDDDAVASEDLKTGAGTSWGAKAAARHAVIMAAPGIKEYDVITAIASIAAHAPDAVVVLIVTKSQAAALTLRIVTPGSVDAEAGGADADADAQKARKVPPQTQQTDWRSTGFPTVEGKKKPRVWLRIYDWDVLHETLSDFEKGLKAPIRRYAMYDLVLADMEDMEGEGGGAVGFGVLFSNLDEAHLRPPHGILLSDARDMVFQSDPFPAFWSFVGAGLATGGDVTGEGTPPPLPPSAWSPEWAKEAAIVVAGEARVATVGQDDWNRGWVSFCYYDLGEAMVNNGQIFCSGTTFGTPVGLHIYLRDGMAPATRACSDVTWEKGMDQGIHNVIAHRYTAEQVERWRERARMGGPFRNGGGKEPMMKEPIEFLDMVEAFQRQLKIHVTHAEDGVICTMALLLRRGIFRNGNGDVLPKEGKSLCSIVHQFDRVPDLFTFYQSRWNDKNDGIAG